MDFVTYPIKKCIVLLKFVEKIRRKIWKSKQIPADWAQAYIILLAKSEDLSQISEFRPIAITSTVGKIFFSVISDRLQVFMIQNCYITRDIQKGFLFGVPGCLEHTFTLMKALKEAKEHQRQILISWLEIMCDGYLQRLVNWFFLTRYRPIPDLCYVYDSV